jgi:hypothetical protein
MNREQWESQLVEEEKYQGAKACNKRHNNNNNNNNNVRRHILFPLFVIKTA